MLSTRTTIRFCKEIEFELKDDCNLSKRDDQYYEDLTRTLRDTFNKITRSCGTRNSGYFNVYADIDQDDSSQAYFCYEIIYRKYIKDLSFDINNKQVVLDLETIYAIIVLIAEQHNLKVI